MPGLWKRGEQSAEYHYYRGKRDALMELACLMPELLDEESDNDAQRRFMRRLIKEIDSRARDLRLAIIEHDIRSGWRG